LQAALPAGFPAALCRFAYETLLWGVMVLTAKSRRTVIVAAGFLVRAEQARRLF
jgi:hypothetical protein